MRISNNRIKMLKREDEQTIVAFGNCVNRLFQTHPTRFQIDILGKVKRYLIDNNQELFESLFMSYLDVLGDVGIDPPEYNLPENIEEGGWYQIPNTGTLKSGKDQAERLRMRANFRQARWDRTKAELGLEEQQVNEFLKLEEDRYTPLAQEVKKLNEENVQLWGQLKILERRIDDIISVTSGHNAGDVYYDQYNSEYGAKQ